MVVWCCVGLHTVERERASEREGGGWEEREREGRRERKRTRGRGGKAKGQNEFVDSGSLDVGLRTSGWV